MSAGRGRLRAVVAGGGVAALEMVLALEADAPGLLDVVLVAPDAEYVERAGSVVEPFGGRPAVRGATASLADLAAAHLVEDALAAVQPHQRTMGTAGGRELAYDVLVVATGATPQRPIAGAVTFGVDAHEALADLVRDVAEDYDDGVAIVVPPGPTWPLPAYELALFAAGELKGMRRTKRVVLVTSESRPLDLFGDEASAEAAEILRAAGVDLRTGSVVAGHDAGRLVLAPSGEELAGVRVASLPTLRGPAVPGLPADEHGFLPVDDQGRVIGVEDVHAIGDAANWPLKQGSLAAQQAAVAARHIARRAGADLPAAEWAPVIEATLWGATHDLHLRARPSMLRTVTELAAPAAGQTTTKVHARHLSAALDRAKEEHR
ncbi:MAG TPA: FAD-dependent oxidoreductase [Baekduia sp.]|nr:FAD-dependent oxidoreductase [Baekduia sp.]